MNKVTASTLIPLGLVLTVAGFIYAIGAKTEIINQHGEKIKNQEEKMSYISNSLINELREINKRLSRLEGRLYK